MAKKKYQASSRDFFENRTARWLSFSILGALGVSSARVSVAEAVDSYYWNGMDITSTASWHDTTGSTPPSFTATGLTFYIANGQTASVPDSWTVGSGSVVDVEDGGSINANNSNPSLVVSLESGSTYTVNSNYSNYTSQSIDSGSTFIYNGGVFRPSVTYGSLVIAPGQDLTPGAISPSGNLTISNSGTTSVAAVSDVQWGVGGNLAITTSLNLTSGAGVATVLIDGGLNNTGTLYKTGTGAAQLNFTGSGSSNVTWGTLTTTNFNNLSIDVGADRIIIFQDSPELGAASFSVEGMVNLNSQSLTQSGLFSANFGSSVETGTINENSISTALSLQGYAHLQSDVNLNLGGTSGGSVVFDASSGNAAEIDGPIGLGGLTRTFDIGATGATADLIVNGVISNGGINKIGAGVLAMGGDNTYSGGTSIVNGTLQANTSDSMSSATGSGPVIVKIGGTLSGGSVVTPGRVSGSVTVNMGGMITAGTGAGEGDAVGTLAVATSGGASTLTLNSGATLVDKVTVDGDTPQFQSDVLVMSGLSVVSGSQATIQIAGTSNSSGTGMVPTFTNGQNWVLAAINNGTAALDSYFANGISNYFNLTISEDLTSAGYSASNFHLSEAGDTSYGGGEDIVVTYDDGTSSAPEPTSMLLLGVVASPLLLGRRRRA